MEWLPVELLAKICSHLCFHCQNPGLYPNADLPDVRHDKAALARLCRTSKKLSNVVQPFVYHYYATGNLPISVNTEDQPNTSVVVSALGGDRLPSFLRTVIQRPELAAHVRALQLVESDKIIGCTPDVITLLNAASEAVGVKCNRPQRKHWEDEWWPESNYPPVPFQYPQDWPRQPDWKRKGFRRQVHRWLEELALLLLPRVETVLIARDYSCRFFCLEESGKPFPALRKIALRPCVDMYRLEETVALFAAACQLETLHIINPFPDSDHATAFLPLQSVRRLLVHGIVQVDFESVVGGCKSLEELHFTSGGDGAQCYKTSRLMRMLQPHKSTLRKLCLSWVFSERPREGLSYERHILYLEDEWGLWGFSRVRHFDHFRDFPKLEVLVLDQLMIHERRVSPPVVNLVNFLPPGIRELHVLSVYMSFFEDLKTLAKEAPRLFPGLRLVHISVVEDLCPERVAEMDRFRTIEPILRDAGIAVRWSTNVVSGAPRASVPGIYPGSTSRPFPPTFDLAM